MDLTKDAIKLVNWKQNRMKELLKWMMDVCFL